MQIPTKNNTISVQRFTIPKINATEVSLSIIGIGSGLGAGAGAGAAITLKATFPVQEELVYELLPIWSLPSTVKFRSKSGEIILH